MVAGVDHCLPGPDFEQRALGGAPTEKKKGHQDRWRRRWGIYRRSLRKLRPASWGRREWELKDTKNRAAEQPARGDGGFEGEGKGDREIQRWCFLFVFPFAEGD